MRIRIRDPESFLSWIRDGKIRIRDKHPGSSTLSTMFLHASSSQYFESPQKQQRCGSGMFIPDPDFFRPDLTKLRGGEKVQKIYAFSYLFSWLFKVQKFKIMFFTPKKLCLSPRKYG
jgi:hypothetical protein